MKQELLHFKWTVSKGQDTYGYNICSLWIRGRKINSCMGGGYGMRGVCFASWLMDNYKGRIERLEANYGSVDNGKGFYGLGFYSRGDRTQKRKGKTGRMSLNGACGFGAMEKITEKIGLSVECLELGIYLIEEGKDEKEKNNKGGKGSGFEVDSKGSGAFGEF